MTDNGVIQQTLDAVLDEAATDPTAWKVLSGNATVPTQALDNAETFAQYLRSIATGSVLRPPLRAKLDIRVHPTPGGPVRVLCYLCNDTLRDTVQRSRDQHNILAACQLQGTLVRGTLVPVELLPVPQDYQFDRNVWAVGHGASVIVLEDRRVVQTKARARYKQLRRTTNQQPSARFEDLIRDPFGTLEAIRRAMVAYATDWQMHIIDRNGRGLRADELEQCRQDLVAFRDEEARFAAGTAALARDERLQVAFVRSHLSRILRREVEYP